MAVLLPCPMPVTMAMPPASHNTMSRELVMVFPVPTQSHSVRSGEYQPPISVTERATAALVGRPCIGPLAGLPSFRARPSPSPLSRVLWEGGRADGPPFSLPRFLSHHPFICSPHTQIHKLMSPLAPSLWTDQTCSSATKLFAHQTSEYIFKVYQSWKSSTCYGAREWG